MVSGLDDRDPLTDATLEFTIKPLGGTIVITASGELTTKTINLERFGGQTIEIAHQPETSYIIINLSDVHYMDSTALGTFVSAEKRLRLKGNDKGHLILVIPEEEETLRTILKITSLDRLFSVVTSVEKAEGLIANNSKTPA